MMTMNIHNIKLSDYELETREELVRQMNDCSNAIRGIYGKLNEVERKGSFIFSSKKEITAALEKEKRAYEVEELKLSMVLELIDTTGRGY